MVWTDMAYNMAIKYGFVGVTLCWRKLNKTLCIAVRVLCTAKTNSIEIEKSIIVLTKIMNINLRNIQ